MKYLALIFDVWKRPAAKAIFFIWSFGSGLVISLVPLWWPSTSLFAGSLLNLFITSMAVLIILATLLWSASFRLKLLTWVDLQASRLDRTNSTGQASMIKFANDPAWLQAGCMLIAVNFAVIALVLIRPVNS